MNSSLQSLNAWKYLPGNALILLIIQLLAGSNAYAQSLEVTKVSLHAVESTPVEIFDMIEAKTDYTFGYNQAVASLDTKVSIHARNTSMEKVLRQLSREANLAFKRIDQSISVSPTEEATRVKAARTERVINGRVIDAATEEPLVSATVRVKGMNVATLTDLDGGFELTIPDEADTIVISYLGFVSKDLPIGTQTTFEVSLEPSSDLMDQVVVTALGISREERGLGYAVTKVTNEDIVRGNELSLTNSLTGKVAGLQVTRSGNGLSGSSRIVLRGDRSLDLNQNQALFVIDGVPVSNALFGTANNTAANRGGGATDFGNAINEIDPYNIESVTVLKGPSAAALYGSRGANGVILITTKHAKGQKGIQIAYNGSLMFERILRWADFQNEYGAGRDGQGRSEGGVYDASNGADFGNSRNFGPRFEGQTFNQIDETGGVSPRPWEARADILNDFFETGIHLTNNVTISGGTSKNDFRLSMTDQRTTGTVPFTNLDRTKIALSSGFQTSEKFSLRSNIQYVRSTSDNIATSGYAGDAGMMYSLNWFQRNRDMNEFREFTTEQLTDPALAVFNPWGAARDINNSFEKDRFIGQVRLMYQLSPEWSFMLRSGGDFFTERRRLEFPINPRMVGGDGQYDEQDILFAEVNTDFLVTYDKDLSEAVQLSVSLGGNNLYQLQRNLITTIPDIAIPGTYNLLNSSQPPVVNPSQGEKIINSMYGFAQLSLFRHTYVDVSARNDWSSTLPVANNSYFYPSLSVSHIFSDALNLESDIFSFGKVRASFAQVGNDTDPYLTNRTFQTSGLFGNNLGATQQTFIENDSVKPEITSSLEIGLDLRFFKGRLGLDMAYYATTTRDQLILAPISEATGFQSKLINVGETRARGVELALYAKPVQTFGGFSWDVSINVARNRSEVVELGNNIESLELGRSGVTIEAREGERFGNIYGFDFLRSPDGQIVHGENGLPLRGEEAVLLGNYNPDWQGGIQNSFAYKGFGLNVLFDFRLGGDIYVYTHSQGTRSGSWTNSLEGRDEGLIGDGVIENEDGTYRENDVLMIPVGTDEPSVYDYYQAFYTEGIQSHSVFDASFVKLREVALSYSLPASVLEKTPFKGLGVSLVGRNLLLWTDVPVVDPEVLTLNGANLLPGIEAMTFPPTRTFGFTLNATF